MKYGIPVFRKHSGVHQHVGFLAVSSFPKGFHEIVIATTPSIDVSGINWKPDDGKDSFSQTKLVLDWLSFSSELKDLHVNNYLNGLEELVYATTQMMVRSKFGIVPDGLTVVPPDGPNVERDLYVCLIS